MCKAPRNLEDGTQVACHECSQCRENAIRDWEGRCIAESRSCVEAGGECWFVTLTYGRNSVNEVLHPRAVVLTYSDVQKFLKLLRRHGYAVRYFVTGEHGERNGRCHWHALLFFEGKAPPLVGKDQYGNWVENARDKRFNHYRLGDDGEVVMVHDPETGEKRPAMWWPHGFSEWKPFAPHWARYAAKYVQKDILDPNAERSLPHMSKKPPLGAAYFEALAQRYVDAYLAPQDLGYSFREVKYRKGKRKGQPVKYRLKDVSAERFLEAYCERWRRTHPEREFPPSELIEAWELHGFVGGYPKVLRRELERYHASDATLQYWEPERPTKAPFVLTEEYLAALDAAEDDWWTHKEASEAREREAARIRDGGTGEAKRRLGRIVRARENVESDRRVRRGERQ